MAKFNGRVTEIKVWRGDRGGGDWEERGNVEKKKWDGGGVCEILSTGLRHSKLKTSILQPLP